MLKSRSTDAEDGKDVLYLRNILLMVGYLFKQDTSVLSSAKKRSNSFVSLLLWELDKDRKKSFLAFDEG